MADKLAAAGSGVHVLHRLAKLGLGTAYVDGFRWGLERGYERFFEMDADLSHDPKYLPRFAAALDQIETTYRALCCGLRVVELPIVFVDRRVGESKMRGQDILEAILGVIRMRVGSSRHS